MDFLFLWTFHHFDFLHIDQSEDSSSPPSCGDIYIEPDGETHSVTWQWFACEKSQTCIHIDNRCDLHPHPDCLYEGVAEDEEDCMDEYTRKNLIQRSANFKCPSAIHNGKTTWQRVAGITVQILGTICDGIPECFNGLDELFCGFTKTKTILIGKFYIVILHL